MALSADRTYETVPPNPVVTAKAGAADTLYKGALVNIGTDGLVKVADDVTSEYPAGVVRKQVVAAGSNAEDVLIDTGKLWIAHTGAAATDVGQLFYATADDTLADSATNVSALGICIDWEAGLVLIDTNQRVL